MITKRERRFLRTVEWLGNALPHPVILFIILTISLIVVSMIGQYFNISAPDPRPPGAKGRNDDGIIYIVSLLDADGVRKILSNLVTNFTGFAPLGTVLVSLLGVGIAERSGLISATLRLIVTKAPAKVTTIAVVFAGIMSNMASETWLCRFNTTFGNTFSFSGKTSLGRACCCFCGSLGWLFSKFSIRYNRSALVRNHPASSANCII